MFSQLCTYPKKIQNKKANIAKRRKGLLPKSFKIFTENTVFYTICSDHNFLPHLPEPPYLPTLPTLYLFCLSFFNKTVTKKNNNKEKVRKMHAHKQNPWKYEIRNPKMQAKDQWGKNAHTKLYATKIDPKISLSSFCSIKNLKIS